MPRKSDQPLETVTVNLVEGDKEILQKFYPKPIGYGIAIRTLIHEHCKMLLETENREGNITNDKPSLTTEQLGELLKKHSSGGDDPVDRAA